MKRCQDAAVTTEEADEGLLMYWNQNAVCFPDLSKLAMKYLAIPAISVPSERAFSTVGHTVNAKRGCV